jgi:hypothetical protein
MFGIVVVIIIIISSSSKAWPCRAVLPSWWIGWPLAVASSVQWLCFLYVCDSNHTASFFCTRDEVPFFPRDGCSNYILLCINYLLFLESNLFNFILILVFVIWSSDVYNIFMMNTSMFDVYIFCCFFFVCVRTSVQYISAGMAVVLWSVIWVSSVAYFSSALFTGNLQHFQPMWHNAFLKNICLIIRTYYL